jgi:hypothetical protein
MSGGGRHGSGSIELNIWGNAPGNYSFWAANGPDLPGDVFVSFDGTAAVTLTAVPEPSSIALGAIGALLGLVGYRLYVRRSA